MEFLYQVGLVRTMHSVVGVLRFLSGWSDGLAREKGSRIGGDVRR